jgi:hypothetical protein
MHLTPAPERVALVAVENLRVSRLSREAVWGVSVGRGSITAVDSRWAMVAVV